MSDILEEQFCRVCSAQQRFYVGNHNPKYGYCNCVQAHLTYWSDSRFRMSDSQEHHTENCSHRTGYCNNCDTLMPQYMMQSHACPNPVEALRFRPSVEDPVDPNLTGTCWCHYWREQDRVEFEQAILQEQLETEFYAWLNPSEEEPEGRRLPGEASGA